MTVNDVARSLPDPDVLRDHCRALAMLDAILSPDWSSRYYSFDSRWSPTEELASMRNGSGDEYSIVFAPVGVYVRGFDHESPMSPYAEDGVWPGVLDSVPEEFRSCVEEPAFNDDGVPTVTACLWRRTTDGSWQTGEIDFPEGHADPDGADWLFRLLTDRSPEAYASFAVDYYEVPVDLDTVRHVCALRPLTDDVVRALNVELTLADVAEDIAEIGYPTT
ncbi:hypothetical protein ACIBCA_04240 [Kitasatospora sp. NPDC051170]|uniref:hypothetical protein n=1 Tax=Kitasatospora sp. NPDC051170 TaxID=3364056 RepID=UPI00378AF74F